MSKDVHVTSVGMNEEVCTSKLSPKVNKIGFEHQNMMDVELKNKPPDLVNKEICSHSNHCHFGVIKLDTVFICLTCKTVINYSKLDLCHKNHLSSKEHRVNQADLFKQCFPNHGLCSKNNEVYNYISSNSSLDFSSATDMSTNKLNFICFVCKYEIPYLQKSESVLVDEVLYHFKDLNHFRNVQDNFSWICNLPSRGQITFDKTLFYCSMCNESISSDYLIETVVIHIRSKHYEDCIILDFEEGTTSQSYDGCVDCEEPDIVSDDSDLTHTGESFCFDDNNCNGASALSLLKMQVAKHEKGEETEDKHVDNYFYLCTECGENINIIDDDFEISVLLHSGSHKQDKHLELTLPTKQIDLEHRRQKTEKTLDLDLARTRGYEDFSEDKHQSRVLLKEPSIHNSHENIAKGHKNQDHKQKNFEEEFPTKINNDATYKFFCDLSDCLPVHFHEDLAFVSIKSNHLHCTLCISAIGAVQNVFDSSFSLCSHFSSFYHKNEMDKIVKNNSEINKSKIKQMSSKKNGEESDTISEKMLSCELSSKRQKQGKLGDCCKLPVIPKQADFDSSSDNAPSKVQIQAEVHNIPNNIHIVEKLFEGKINPEQRHTCEMEPQKLEILNTPRPISDIFNDSNLRVHQEFFKHELNSFYCCLCSFKIDGNETDLKDHITGITHKVKFLSQLKKSLKDSKRHQVNFLLFMNRQLYCSVCKCYITPWTSFAEICEGVDTHFEALVHAASEGEKKLETGEACQGIISRNEGSAMVEVKTPFVPLSNKQNEFTSVSDENNKKTRNICREDLSQNSSKTLVENLPNPSKHIAAVSSISASFGASLNELDEKLKPAKELLEDLQVNNVNSVSSILSNIFDEKPYKLPEFSKNEKLYKFPATVDVSFKMGLSLKRLFSTAPMVQVNKYFIEQVGEQFGCILCSKCIPYSPQKYVLAKNFNAHFKSVGHVFIVNKISKVENVPKVTKIFNRNVKLTRRLSKEQSLKTPQKKSFFKAYCHSFEMDNINPTVASLTKNPSQKNHSQLIPTISENKHMKVIKTDCAKVCTSKTSALKRFFNKYKRKMDLNLLENNQSSSVSKKWHPLLQQLLPGVPLLQANKQYIVRKRVNFYCTLCCKFIKFSTNKKVLAKYFNAHLNFKTHNSSLLKTKLLNKEHGGTILENSSTKGPSKNVSCQPSFTANKTEREFFSVLNHGKTAFREIYGTLLNLKNEEIFFCNHCMKHIRTVLRENTSFEYSITQHCSKVHKKGSKIKNDRIVDDVVWANNSLKSNIAFIGVSHGGAGCCICSKPVTFSKSNNVLIFNFLLHFQDDKHKQVFRSIVGINKNVGRKIKKYRPDLEANEMNSLI